MYFQRLWQVTLVITVAHAFRNTSPLFLASTSEILISSPQIASASSLTLDLASQLGKCPSDTYIVVSQPGVNAADFTHRRSAPHLRRRIQGEDEHVRSSLSVADVIGEIDADVLVDGLEKSCGAQVLGVDASTGSFAMVDDMKPRVIRLDFPTPPSSSKRADTLAENDAFLASVLDMIPSSTYTLIYITTPTTAEHHSLITESEVYGMENAFPSSAHTELKRESTLGSQKRGNVTLPMGGLFERYQYFTPGLFMGLAVFLLLASILYVGISGIAGLQVSYAAFDKEMGPMAQKKQQ